jgi:hypothetical protein
LTGRVKARVFAFLTRIFHPADLFFTAPFIAWRLGPNKKPVVDKLKNKWADGTSALPDEEGNVTLWEWCWRFSASC